MNKRPVNSAKAARVEILKTLLSQSKSVAVMDYTGLKVAAATDLRRKIKASGGEMKVDKNTLFRIALQSSDFQLNGLSAFIFSNADEVSSLKVLADFMKKSGVGKFKMGFIGDRVLSATEIEALADTPPKETSVSKLMFLLQFHTSKLVRVLDAIAKSKNTPVYSPPNLGGDTEGVRVGGDIS